MDQKKQSFLCLFILLLIVGTSLWWTHIPATFIIDENHHIAAVVSADQPAKQIPIGAGLPTSIEMATFDAAIAKPLKKGFRLSKSPLTPTIPATYPLLLSPYKALGFSGFVYVNILAFLCCAVVVFYFTKSYSQLTWTPWLALFFLLGATSYLEYAQGLWPHMLSASLCSAGFFFADQARRQQSILLACISGILLGLATGVRYPNVIYSVALATALFIWTRRKRLSFAYALAYLIPLSYNAWYNFIRLQTWNPISKGGSYLRSFSGRETDGNRILDAFIVLWTKIVDFSCIPVYGKGGLRQSIEHSIQHYGAPVLDGVLKKSWLQSSPWIIIALAAVIMAWLPRHRNALDVQKSKVLRATGLLLFMWLGAFAYAGLSRHDGWCYNQRYLLDLLPMLCIALAWECESIGLTKRELLAGSGLALLAFLAMYWYFPLLALSRTRIWILAKTPLILALLCFVGWILAKKQKSRLLFSLLLGSCFAWSLAVHLTEDVQASRKRRNFHLKYYHKAAKILAHHPKQSSILLAYGGVKDPFGPLLLHYPVTIVDPWIDQHHDTMNILDAARRRNYPIYLAAPKFFSRSLLRQILRKYKPFIVSRRPMFLRLEPRSPSSRPLLKKRNSTFK